VVAIAKPHAKRNAVPGRTAFTGNILLPEWSGRDPSDRRQRRRRIMGWRWRTFLTATEQKIEQVLRLRRSKRHDANRRKAQRSQQHR
jgi:hypothetical protein